MNTLEKTLVGEGVCVGVGLLLYCLGLKQSYDQQLIGIRETLQNPLVFGGGVLTYSSLLGFVLTGLVHDHQN